MKYLKKITAFSLLVLLLNTLVIPTYAESAPTEKQEVIYVLADNSGKAKDIEVVNIFDGGDITDYGDYSTVKMLNTTDKIKQDGDKISISSSADKVYYQGKLKSVLIPWNISIHYFLDGKEYNASELAGKSGALEIHFSVSKNDGYSGDFYENYALQANFMLDSDKCANIVADGATIANVGKNIGNALRGFAGGVKNFGIHCGYFCKNVSIMIKRKRAIAKRKKAEEERRERERQKAERARMRAERGESDGLVQVHSRTDRRPQQNRHPANRNKRR